MLKITIFCITLCWTFLTVFSDAMIGPGKWNLLKIEKKSGDSNKFEFDIEKRKYNRSHDIFKGSMTFHEDFTELFGARIDVCKYVDGGCKQYQVINEESVVNLISKYVESNFKEMFELAGVKDAEVPIAAGTYEIEEYMWNWDDMPDEGPYGRYCAHSCVMELEEEVGCITTEVSFEEEDEEE